MRFTLPILAALLLIGSVTTAVRAASSNVAALAAFLRPTSPKPSQLRVIFIQIQRGSLVPNAAGTVPLPPKDAVLTKDHRAYVTRKPDGLLLVLFPTWIGKGSNLTGYLYCSRPLRPTETHKDFYANKYDALDINTPGPWDAQRPAVPTEVILQQRLSPTVYRVSRSLD